MIGVMLAIALAALPPYLPLSFNDDGFCASYGVRETNMYFSDTVFARGLPFDKLQVACADAVRIVGPVHGCAMYRIKDEIPVTILFWLDGSYCAMVHEWCHAANMSWHTEEFIRRLNSGDQNPSCPPKRNEP